MNESLPEILLIALAVIGSLSLMGLLRDLRTGTSRLAHETHDVAREQLPLNYWLGVASKAAGVAVSLVLAVVVIHQLM